MSSEKRAESVHEQQPCSALPLFSDFILVLETIGHQSTRVTASICAYSAGAQIHLIN